jgi:hypothetical protein
MANAGTAALQAAFRGQLIRLGNRCYDEFRSVFNAMLTGIRRSSPVVSMRPA